MSSTPSGQPALRVPSRPTFACTRCATRKVKCDRQRPCRACVNHKVNCVFLPPAQPQRRRRLAQVRALTERLSYYETLLQAKGVDTHTVPDTPSQPDHSPGQSSSSSETIAAASQVLRQHTPSSVSFERDGTVSKTHIIQTQGRSVLVDNSLWSRIVEEVDISESSSEDGSDAEASEHDFGYILRMQPGVKSRFQHPSPERITQLWQVYRERVAPLTKVLHGPTVTLAIQKAVDNTTAIPRYIEALLFAIYSTAVMSLDDTECLQKLGEPRKKLLSRFIAATKAALTRAEFMSTTRLVVLQALLLHILSVCDMGPRAIWSLTGVAMRIAQGMGLDRDGACLGLPPFEAEMRRRVWWMLKTLDRQVAERCGLSKFRDLDIRPGSTERPTNVNDDQLHPGMTSPPTASDNLTEMAFVALRYELAAFGAASASKFRQKGKDPDMWEQELASRSDGDEAEPLKEIQDLIETKYLRYCDPSQPLHLMTMLMGRSALNTIRFLTHHPRRWSRIEQTPPSESQFVWEISIKLLEQHNMLQTMPQLKRFAWHAACVMQWHAFIHILDTLRVNPLDADNNKAWDLVRQTFENIPAIMTDTRKPIYLAVGSLCLKAYDAHEAALLQKEHGARPVPLFICKLRQRRDKTMAKTQAREARSSQAENTPTSQRTDHNHRTGRPDPGQPNHVMRPQPLANYDGSAPDAVAADKNPWFTNEFGDSYALGMNDSMVVDSLLAQNMGDEEGIPPTIAWAQWDAWLAESNAMPSDDGEYGAYF